LWKGGENRAELWGKDRWMVYRGGIRDDRFARVLRDDYADRLRHGGPGDGYYGPAILADLASRMGGTFKFYKPVRLRRDDKS
jgi:hypothetical protein